MPNKRLFTVDVNFPEAGALMKQFGVEPGGRVQMNFANEVLRHSDDYVPKKEGFLGASGRIEPDGCGIQYPEPYARVHWYGKVMVDPITQKAAFHNKESGRFWSRPKEEGIRKEVSDRDMQYQEAPMRGPRWVERSWIDHKDEILHSLKSAILERRIDE